MPCDYSKYPKNWKSEIRPAILERDGNCCKFCKAKNNTAIFRGFVAGEKEVYQDFEGNIFDAKDGTFLKCDQYELIEPLSGDPNQKAIKVVLTIMHLDHDTTNNDYDNLAAGCQKCHLNYDKDHHKKNSNATRIKKKGLQSLF